MALDWRKPKERDRDHFAPIDGAGNFAFREDVFEISDKTNTEMDALFERQTEVFKAAPHQSFGDGPYFCQGIPVARRAVGQIMLPILFYRFPNMSLSDPNDSIWRDFGFRGPIQIPVLLN